MNTESQNVSTVLKLHVLIVDTVSRSRPRSTKYGSIQGLIHIPTSPVSYACLAATNQTLG